MTISVRRVTADDWPHLRDVRLRALRDELAPIAFTVTYAEEAAHGDGFWRARATAAATSNAIATFLAFDETGRGVASATAIRENAGQPDWAGVTVEQDQVQVVGVYVEPAARGAGLLGTLVDGLVAWAGDLGIDRVRLHVHTDNARARAAYQKLGFAETGESIRLDVGLELEMVRAVSPCC